MINIDKLKKGLLQIGVNIISSAFIGVFLKPVFKYGIKGDILLIASLTFGIIMIYFGVYTRREDNK